MRRGRESYHFTTGNGFQRLGSADGGRVRVSYIILIVRTLIRTVRKCVKRLLCSHNTSLIFL